MGRSEQALAYKNSQLTKRPLFLSEVLVHDRSVPVAQVEGSSRIYSLPRVSV